MGRPLRRKVRFPPFRKVDLVKLFPEGRAHVGARPVNAVIKGFKRAEFEKVLAVQFARQHADPIEDAGRRVGEVEIFVRLPKPVRNEPGEVFETLALFRQLAAEAGAVPGGLQDARDGGKFSSGIVNRKMARLELFRPGATAKRESVMKHLPAIANGVRNLTKRKRKRCFRRAVFRAA